MRDCLARAKVDLVLLDLVLPGEDGLQLAREIRAQPGSGTIGIIMLTGRSDMVDMVVGLEVGADDYIAKAVPPAGGPRPDQERPAPTATGGAAFRGPGRRGEVVRFDGWQLDLGRRELKAPDGSEIALTTGEFDLLVTFAPHPGRVLNRDQLMDLTRGRQWEAIDRSIDAQVARSAAQDRAGPQEPTLVKSVRAVGYVFTGRIR